MRRRALIQSRLAPAGLAVLVAAGACHKADKGEPTVVASVGAATIVVAPQAFTETLGAIGNVMPRIGHVATLMAPAAARVGNVMVAVGQHVRVGEALIELDPAPFRAALQSAIVALDAANKAAERQKRLAQEGIVAPKDAETAAAEAAKAQSDEVVARRAMELSVLKSPIDGVVTRMSATLGASVDPAGSLVEIADPAAVDIVLSVTPTDAARVRTGSKVALTAGQTANGEPLGIGDVVAISGTVDSASRSVAVRVQAPSTRRPLRIGETVFGAIALGTRPSAIVIPADALVPEGEDFKVFVVDASNVAHERPVKVGGKSDKGVEILEGLKAGERIVTTGAYGLSDSAKVVPLGTLPAGDKPDENAKGGGEKSDSSKGDAKKEAPDSEAKATPKAAPKAAPKTPAKPAKP